MGTAEINREVVDDEKPVLHIQIEPHWNQVTQVRETCANFIETHGFDAEAVYAVAMAASELAENASKYGSFGSKRSAIEINVVANRNSILVEVRSPVSDGDLEHLFRLDRIIQWIRGFQDPFEAYVERLKEISTQQLENPESGLGLVRIAYEGQSTLDFFLTDKNTLSVSAMYALKEREDRYV